MKEEKSDENDHDSGDSAVDLSYGNSNKSDDFVIQKGFPALYLPESGFCKPWVEGDEPIPLFPFTSYQNALDCTHLPTVLEDCEAVFTARTKEAHEAYSSGATFFVPCTMKPRCALEGLAMLIFQQHTKHLPKGLFRTECSGAEWWTLILEQDDDEEDDEVGMHFDADYGLEEQMKNLLIHPRLSTVTYLTNVGVPTLVLDIKSPQPALGPSISNAVATLQGGVERGWLSSPSIGKHISFDGRLLHGAPGAFFPAAVKNEAKKQGNTEFPLRSNKKAKIGEHHIDVFKNKRVTFLVNIWLNHCPLDAELLDQDVCNQLKTPWKISHEQQQENIASLEDGRKQNGNSKDNPLENSVFRWKSQMRIGSGDGDIVPDKIESITLDAKENAFQQGSNILEEAIISHHHVTFSLSSLIVDKCKEVATQVGKDGSSVQLQFQQDSFQIIVGEECDSDEDDGENEDND